MIKQKDSAAGDDFEVVPLTPLRRLEKRIESIETTKTTQNLERFVDKIIDMVELNQKIVDEVVRANQGLREDLAVLVGKMTDTQDKLSQFISMLREASESEMEGADSHGIAEAIKPFADRITEATSKSIEMNSALMDTLSSLDRSMRKLTPASQGSITSSILARRASEGKAI